MLIVDSRAATLPFIFVSNLNYVATQLHKKLFSPYKIIDSENFIKVSQNPNKVARDTQGLPTVPHNDFGGLNFKCLVSKYLLLMTTSVLSSPKRLTSVLRLPL